MSTLKRQKKTDNRVASAFLKRHIAANKHFAKRISDIRKRRNVRRNTACIPPPSSRSAAPRAGDDSDEADARSEDDETVSDFAYDSLSEDEQRDEQEKNKAHVEAHDSTDDDDEDDEDDDENNKLDKTTPSKLTVRKEIQ